MKWWWRYRIDPNSMWSHIIRGIHNLKHKSIDCIAKKSICGVWKNIDNIKEELEKRGNPLEIVMKKQVNDGKNTFFWLEDWSGKGIFKSSFPALYALEKKKSCMVADRIGSDELKWG